MRRMKRRTAASVRSGIGRVHVLAHEMLGRSNDLVWEAKALEHRPRHLGADELVTIKVRAVLRARLADVVEQGRQAKSQIAWRRSIEGGEIMTPDIVGVPLVLLDPDALHELGPKTCEQAGLRRSSSPIEGCAAAKSFTNSSWTRSGDTVATRWAAAVIADRATGVTSYSKRAANWAARSMRKRILFEGFGR